VTNEHAAELEQGEMDQENADLRSVVSRIMEALHLNQRQFASRWGVSEATVSKILSGEQQDVTLRQARRLCSAFGLDPSALFQPPGNPET